MSLSLLRVGEATLAPCLVTTAPDPRLQLVADGTRHTTVLHHDRNPFEPGVAAIAVLGVDPRTGPISTGLVRRELVRPFEARGLGILHLLANVGLGDLPGACERGVIVDWSGNRRRCGKNGR